MSNKRKRYVHFAEYITSIPITRREVIVRSLTGGTQSLLSDKFKILIRRLLSLMPTPAGGKSYYKFSVHNILVNEEDGQPFLSGVYSTSYRPFLAQQNYVADIIEKTIFKKNLTDVPADFEDLLKLLRRRGHSASYLIKNHCSIVTAVDKKDLFLRMYNHLNDVVQVKEPDDYDDILKKIAYPTDWATKIRGNRFLMKFFRGSWYNLQRTCPRQEVLRYMRNSFSHGLEHSVHKVSLLQQYESHQIGEMLESVFDSVISSLQQTLFDKGHLNSCAVESLFQL